jgi:mannose-6-phosphate isomerase-like protein (cupin superfamily)
MNVDEIHNPRTGQRIRFVEHSPGLLRCETVNPPTGVFEPEHVHPEQESRASVISGRLVFLVNGERRVVGPGEEIVIAAGAPHSFCAEGTEDAVAVQEFRPALESEAFFRTFFGLAERDELDEHGMPSLLKLAEFGPRFAREIRVTKPPWWVQRLVYAVLAPVVRLRRS